MSILLKGTVFLWAGGILIYLYSWKIPHPSLYDEQIFPFLSISLVDNGEVIGIAILMLVLFTIIFSFHLHLLLCAWLIKWDGSNQIRIRASEQLNNFFAVKLKGKQITEIIYQPPKTFREKLEMALVSCYLSIFRKEMMVERKSKVIYFWFFVGLGLSFGVMVANAIMLYEWAVS